MADSAFRENMEVPGAAGAEFDKEAMQTRVVAHVLSCPARGSALQVLQLELLSAPVGAAAAAVRGRYRRLAALLHPDKCALLGAAEAFRRIGDARDELLRLLLVSGTQEEDVDASEACAHEDAGLGDRWWDTWTFPDACPGAPQAMPSTQPTPNDLADPQLWVMSLPDLQQLVAVRQREVLRPPPSAPGEPPPPPVHERQRCLRAARSVLAQRLEEAPREAPDGGGGGGSAAPGGAGFGGGGGGARAGLDPQAGGFLRGDGGVSASGGGSRKRARG